MSQFYVGVTAGSLPPSVPLSFTTDSGIATPVANNLNILADDTTNNNANGLTTSGAGNTVTVLLTNRLQGTGSTVDAATSDIITFSLGATPGTYAFEVRVAGFESTTPAGVGYSLFGTVRTTGAAGTVAGTVDRINNEEAALVLANATIVASGNNAVVQVTGVAGFTISWSVVGLYTFVG